jgi:hypothetical protein
LERAAGLRVGCGPGQLADLGALAQNERSIESTRDHSIQEALQYAKHAEPTVKQRNDQNCNDRYTKYSLATAALLPILI